MRVGAGCVRQLHVPVAAPRQEGVTKFRKLARPIREDTKHCLAVGVAQCDISACVDGEADVLRKSLLAGSVEPQREPSRCARRHLDLSDPHVSRVPDVTAAKPGRVALVIGRFRHERAQEPLGVTDVVGAVRSHATPTPCMK